MNNVITIDGLSGSGKSSIGKSLAKSINFTFLDSGILYRAISYIMLLNKFPQDLSGVLSAIKLIQNGDVYFENINNIICVKINNKNIKEEDLQTVEISEVAAKISPFNELRTEVNTIIRNLLKDFNLVVAGRDIGSVVFPDSKVKFFVEVPLEIRAQRRHAQLKNTSIEKVLDHLKLRDYKDLNREYGKLIKLEDSIVLDNTRPFNEVMMYCLSIVNKRLSIT